MAFDAELREIEQSRARRLAGSPPAPDVAAATGLTPDAPVSAEESPLAIRPAHALRVAAEMDLVGVALSGGGVRSATFNLGILQALAEFGLLTRVDYLSTVSGGGYIGAWLASWSKRVRAVHPADGVRTVQARLQTEPLTEPDAVAVRAVRFLREYSNYLTPSTGVFQRRHVDDDRHLAAQHDPRIRPCSC